MVDTQAYEQFLHQILLGKFDADILFYNARLCFLYKESTIFPCPTILNAPRPQSLQCKRQWFVFSFLKNIRVKD